MGGGGQQSSSGSNKSQQGSLTIGTSDNKTGEQRKWLGEALNVYGPQLGQNQVYQGQTLAPFSPAQTSSLQEAGGFAGSFDANAPIPLYKETGTALESMLSGKAGPSLIDTDQASQVYQRTRAQPRYEEFDEMGRPLIREEFSGPGFWGSSRANKVVEEGRNLERDVSRGREGFLWDVDQANRQIEENRANRSLAAVSPSMAYGSQPTQVAREKLAGLQDVYGAGALQQQQQQAEINSAIDKWAQENRITDPENMEILMNLLGLNYSQSSTVGKSWGESAGSWGSSGWNANIGGTLFPTSPTPTT